MVEGDARRARSGGEPGPGGSPGTPERMAARAYAGPRLQYCRRFCGVCDVCRVALREGRGGRLGGSALTRRPVSASSSAQSSAPPSLPISAQTAAHGLKVHSGALREHEPTEMRRMFAQLLLEADENVLGVRVPQPRAQVNGRDAFALGGGGGGSRRGGGGAATARRSAPERGA